MPVVFKLKREDYEQEQPQVAPVSPSEQLAVEEAQVAERVAPRKIKFSTGDARRDLQYDPEFQKAARIYYSKIGNPYERVNKLRPAPKFDAMQETPMAEYELPEEAAPKLETDEDYARAFTWDFRRADSNTLAMAGQLIDARAANKDEDMRWAFSTLKKRWEDYPFFWQKGGEGKEAFLETLSAVKDDPTTWISFGVGAIASKGALAARAVHGLTLNAVTDFVTGASFNWAGQKRDIEYEGGEIDNLEWLAAGGISAAVPATLAAGVAGTTALAKRAYSLYKGFNRETLEQMLPADSAELLSKNLTHDMAKERALTIGVTDNLTGQTPHEILDAATGKPFVDVATGQPTIVKSATEAQRLTSKANKAAKATSSGPTLAYRQLKFKTPGEAKEWADKVGTGMYGSSDINITTSGLLPDGDQILSRRGRLYTWWTDAVQRAIHVFKSVEDIAPELQAAAKANVAAGKFTSADIGFVDTVDLSKQFNLTMNKDLLAEDWLRDGPIMPVASKESPGLYEYVKMPDGKSFFDILFDGMTKAEKNTKYNTANFRRDLGTYMLGTRVQNYEMANAAKAAKGKKPLKLSVDTQAFIKFREDVIANAPDLAMVFEETMNDMAKFNDYLLDFARQHDILDAEAVAKLKGISGIFVPVRHVIEKTGRDARFGIIPTTPGPSTLHKGVRPDAAAQETFVDPIKSYEDMVQIVVKAALVNRTKAQVYRQIQAAGPAMSNRILEEVSPASRSITVSLDNLEKSLKGHGINVDLTSNPQLAPYMSIYYRTSDWIAEKTKGRDFVWVDGKLKEFKFKDPLIGHALTHFGKFYRTSLAEITGAVDNKAVKALDLVEKSNKIAEKLVVNYTPVNMLILAPADSVAAAILNPRLGWRNLPVMNMLYGYGKFAQSLFKEDSMYKEAMLNGGLLSGISSNFGVTSKQDPALAWAIKNGIDLDNIGGLLRSDDISALTRFWNKVNVAFQKNAATRTLVGLKNAAEAATRMGSYGAAKAGGESIAQAAWDASRYSINFRFRGSSELATWLMNFGWPFLRATVQATYQTANLLARKGNKMPALSKLAIMVAGTSALLYYYNMEDPYYQKLTQQEKDMFWHIPISLNDDNTVREYFRWRKPPILGIPANITRRYIEELRKDEVGAAMTRVMLQHMKEVMVNEFRVDENLHPGGLAGFLWGWAAGETPLGTPLTPQGSEGVAGWAQTNHESSGKFFSSTPMIDMYMEWEKLTGMQINPNTLEFFFQSTLGAFGGAAVESMDMLTELADGTFAFNPERVFMLGKVYRDTSIAKKYIGANDILQEVKEEVEETTKALAKAKNDETLAAAVNRAKDKWGDDAYVVAVQIQEKLDAIERMRQVFREEMRKLHSHIDKPPNLTEATNNLYHAYNEKLYNLVEEPQVVERGNFNIKVGPSLRQLYLKFKKAMREPRKDETAQPQAGEGNNFYRAQNPGRLEDTPYVAEAMEAKKPLKNIIQDIQYKSKDQGLRSLAAKLVPKLGDVGIIHDANLTEGAFGITSAKNSDTNPDKTKPTVGFNRSGGWNEVTVLHESIHAAIRNAIEPGYPEHYTGMGAFTGTPRHATISKNEAEAIDKMDVLRRRALAEYEKDPENKRKEQFTTLHEFIAYSMTDPATQDFLKSTSVKNQNLWEEFVGTIGSFFGVKQKTMLDEVLDAGNAVINSLTPQILPEPKPEVPKR